MKKKATQEEMMKASYTGRGQPTYEMTEAESAESQNASHGSNSQLAQNKPFYIAGRYKEYR